MPGGSRLSGIDRLYQVTKDSCEQLNRHSGPDVREIVSRAIAIIHDMAIQDHRAIFLEQPPRNHGIYVYTYYDAAGNAIYHGWTANARQRAKKHYEEAPWAAWVSSVRYQRCSTVVSARKLESQLQRMTESLCHPHGLTTNYHGEDWSGIDREFPVNHVTGTCKLPGGICDVDYLLTLRSAQAHQ
jgi:predicted GIY-YIG superfamily endonuclease